MTSEKKKTENKIVTTTIVGGFFALVGVATFLFVLIYVFTGVNYACRL